MGQAALILFALIYDWVTPFNIVDEIQKGNAAAGLMLGGTLVTLGIILSFAIARSLYWVDGGNHRLRHQRGGCDGLAHSLPDIDR